MLELTAAKLQHKMAYVALENKVACASSEKKAIVKVDSILKKITGIDSKHLHSKNVYIRHQKNSKGAFCVEGVVTKEGFSLYDAELQEEYETIMGEIEDLNDGISYAQKQVEVDRLFQDVSRYNQKVEMAEKIAPLVAEKITETKNSLGKMINAEPVVDFRVQGCSGKFTTECRLVFISSFQDDSSSVVYRWDFGDGSLSRRTNPIHYYKHSGSYIVTLRITDGGKKHTDVSKKFKIAMKPKPRAKEKPMASFSTKKEVYVSGESIDFINLSSSKKAKIKAYRWRFDDGGSSQLFNPKYSYRKPGSYKVHLQVTNSDGLSSEVVENVQVVHPAILFGVDTRKYNRVVRKYGQPDKAIDKSGSLTKAYKYGNDWILVKQNKVECRIKGSGFKTNLMGNPKNCHWYEKNAPTAMYILGQ